MLTNFVLEKIFEKLKAYCGGDSADGTRAYIINCVLIGKKLLEQARLMHSVKGFVFGIYGLIDGRILDVLIINTKILINKLMLLSNTKHIVVYVQDFISKKLWIY